MTLGTLDDAIALAPRLVPPARNLVVGGGFIGLEVAASARRRGCRVTLVEGAAGCSAGPFPRPLPAGAGSASGAGDRTPTSNGAHGNRCVPTAAGVSLSDGNEM